MFDNHLQIIFGVLTPKVGDVLVSPPKYFSH